MTIRTLKDFVELCKTIDLPEWTFGCFEGMDFVIYMNEYRRIVESATESRVKTYVTKLSAPRLWDYNIGYFADIHNATLKVNKYCLAMEKDEEWWTPHIVRTMDIVGQWVKRIFYMNEYEEMEKRLERMRKVLDEKGIQYCDDKAYQEECHRKLKYE